MGSNDAFHAMRRSLSEGQSEALLRKLWLAGGGEQGGDEACQEILRDHLRITLVNNTIKLVDHTGRVIPLPGMDVVDANRDYYLTQPEVDYAARLARLQKFYGKDMKFVSAAEFQVRCQAIIERVKSDPQVANLVKGPYFPFVMPQLAGDLGQLLDDTIVPALERSYKAQFPKRYFNNYRHGEPSGQVTVVPGTRQGYLIKALAEWSVCGVYFPALQGFSVAASREMISRLSEDFILSGLEVPVVAAMYPEIVGRDYNTPGLDMASLHWQSAGGSLYCYSCDGGFGFGCRLLGAYGCCSGGVSVLG